jgi:hypothetical protein
VLRDNLLLFALLINYFARCVWIHSNAGRVSAQKTPSFLCAIVNLVQARGEVHGACNGDCRKDPGLRRNSRAVATFFRIAPRVFSWWCMACSRRING